jgi:hypothetical protein
MIIGQDTGKLRTPIEIKIRFKLHYPRVVTLSYSETIHKSERNLFSNERSETETFSKITETAPLPRTPAGAEICGRVSHSKTRRTDSYTLSWCSS